MACVLTWQTLAWQREEYIGAEAPLRGAIIEAWRETRERLLDNATWLREHKTWMGAAINRAEAEDLKAAAEIWERMIAWAEATNLARQEMLFRPEEDRA